MRGRHAAAAHQATEVQLARRIPAQQEGGRAGGVSAVCVTQCGVTPALAAPPPVTPPLAPRHLSRPHWPPRHLSRAHWPPRHQSRYHRPPRHGGEQNLLYIRTPSRAHRAAPTSTWSQKDIIIILLHGTQSDTKRISAPAAPFQPCSRHPRQRHLTRPSRAYQITPRHVKSQ